jgi:pimeloyl-ACP methyl ester carboxylesterase
MPTILFLALFAAAPEPGTVILIEGVGGFRLMQPSSAVGLRLAGVPHECRTFHWGHGWGRIFLDLQNPANVEARAGELSDLILSIKREAPSRPVYLIGHSGGTGIAVRAAEKLPPDTLRRVVLLSSALSPNRDLRKALSACERGIVSYYSALDCLILGWGTWTFGTIDRAHERSAGHVGFHLPPGLTPAEAALYERLIQVPWSLRMMWTGNVGNHHGSVLPLFLACEVSRWLD